MTVTDYYVTSDAMGSVTTILDADGNVLERRSYDAFGDVTCMAPDGTPVAESPTGLDVGFQGQVRDEVTGLYQMGYRWYNPVLGRWLSRDPLGVSAGINSHAFAINKPNSLNDIMGLEGSPSDCAQKRLSYLREIEAAISHDYSAQPVDCGSGDCCSKISVIVDMGNPCEGFWVCSAKIGHVGVLVGDDFYDWGPAKGTNGILPGRGGPYWSNRNDFAPSRLNVTKRIADLSGGDIVVEIQICVPKSDAKKVKQGWETAYKQAGTGALVFNPCLSNCAHVARVSLLGLSEQADFNLSVVIGSAVPVPLTPARFFFGSLSSLKNTCGPSNGRRPFAKIIHR